MKYLVKKIVFSIPLLHNLYKHKLRVLGTISTPTGLDLEEAIPVYLENPLPENFRVGLVNDSVFNMDGFVSTRAYAPKYERFLRNNGIQYEYYDIRKSDWLEKAERFDCIIWHTPSDPATQYEAAGKIYILEKKLQKHCLPSFDELWSYEDKIYSHFLYRYSKLPEIETFVSFDKKEAMEFAATADYPLIAKIATGSSSYGVQKVDNRRNAAKLIQRAFSPKGIKTYWPYLRQKNYVCFQQFVADADFDLRIMLVGNKLFGYYRYAKKGDYRASGSGLLEKKGIPADALEQAWIAKEKIKSHFLAVDLLFNKRLQQYQIIETSVFIGVDTCKQLIVDGIAGYYEKTGNEYIFREGNYWVQELTLVEFFKALTKPPAIR